MAVFPRFVLYGHHKCATMSLNAIARAVCRRLGLRFRAVFDEQQVDLNLADFVERNKVDFLAFGNADQALAKQLSPHLGAHIIRDPRDIVVSAYFSHRYSHSTASWRELTAHRDKLQSLSVEDGIHAEIEFRQKSFSHMANWDYDQPGIHEFRFEELVSRPYETLLAVFRFLELLDESDYTFGSRLRGLYREICGALYAKTNIAWPAALLASTIPAPEFLTIAWRNRFEARTRGRKEGEENQKSHYRKGQSGDWRNHFTDAHKRQFKDLYPGLVPSLGYEEDDGW